MLFNSLEFGIFFIVVYALYLGASHRLQNKILLIAGYIFYGWWDWRFLGLLWLSTIVDFYCALQMDKSSEVRTRKRYLWLSIGFNLVLLGFFKYFNFFASSFERLAESFGWQVDPVTLHIILPVGISFYTFQSMSYVLDVYRRQVKATGRFWDYAVFISFFPQLMAGPIERAAHMLPQVINPRKISRAQFQEGGYLIFWGLFQKIFVADNLAPIVDQLFTPGTAYHGPLVLLGAYAFAFQVYCDFAGYSNMARGLSKCMGFDLMVNFNLPYFAVNPSDFWKRWHISLSTWLRDYLYIPLGGNRKGPLRTYLNLMLTMTIGGLWHGASWHFVAWGAYHGMLLILHRLLQPVLSRLVFPEKSLKARLWFLARVIAVFHLVCIGWIFFRAASLTQAFGMLIALTAFDPAAFTGMMPLMLQFVYLVFFLLLFQIWQFRTNDLTFILKWRPQAKFAAALTAFYLYLYMEILVNSVNRGGPREFIYFQF